MENQPKNRVLIVDDEPIQLSIFEGILMPTYEVQTLNSGNNILKYLDEFRPDTLLLDLVMPDRDGYDVLKDVRERIRFRNLPIILVTSLDSVGHLARGFNIGCNDFIKKPVEAGELIMRIENQIRNYRTLQSLEERVDTEVNNSIKAQLNLIYSLANASELRDFNLQNHLKRTQAYSKLIAEKLELDKNFSETLFHSCVLHDIGKIKIPDEILLKPEKLTQGEFQLMREHVNYGVQILDLQQLDVENKFIRMARDIIQYHHENFDGSGYLGFKGDKIPRSASIFHLADVLDTILSSRCYKPARSFGIASDMILNGANDNMVLPQHFHPDVLNVFRENLGEFEEISNRRYG